MRGDGFLHRTIAGETGEGRVEGMDGYINVLRATGVDLQSQVQLIHRLQIGHFQKNVVAVFQYMCASDRQTVVADHAEMRGSILGRSIGGAVAIVPDLRELLVLLSGNGRVERRGERQSNAV